MAAPLLALDLADRAFRRDPVDVATFYSFACYKIVKKFE
jgi:hypothetical protein